MRLQEVEFGGGGAGASEGGGADEADEACRNGGGKMDALKDGIGLHVGELTGGNCDPVDTIIADVKAETICQRGKVTILLGKVGETAEGL